MSSSSDQNAMKSARSPLGRQSTNGRSDGDQQQQKRDQQSGGTDQPQKSTTATTAAATNTNSITGNSNHTTSNNKRPSPVAAAEAEAEKKGLLLSSLSLSLQGSGSGTSSTATSLGSGTGSSKKRMKLDSATDEVAGDVAEILVVSALANKQQQQLQQQKQQKEKPIVGKFLDEVDDEDDDRSSLNNTAENASSPPTPTNKSSNNYEDRPRPGSSVKQLKGWLSDFEKKQKEHFERNASQNHHHHHHHHQVPSATPTKPGGFVGAPTPAPTPVQGPPDIEHPSSSSSSANTSTSFCNNAEAMLAKASQEVLASRRGIPNQTPSKPALPVPMARRGRSITKASPGVSSSTATATPIRSRFGNSLRGKDEDVQATNEGYASVSKLSAWLQDDPTRKHKGGGLPIAHRRGPKVSMKSRKFEPMPLNDATRTVEFRKNGVNERKQWLQNAFKKEEDTTGGRPKDGMSVAERAKFFQSAFASKETGEQKTLFRKDDDGHTNVRLAEVGDAEELCSSGMCDVSQYHLSEESPVKYPDSGACNENGSVASVSTCASTSFSIGKQMLESRTERNNPQRGSPAEADNDGFENASVQSRKIAFEKKEEEVRVRGSAVKAHWEADSSSRTYTKKLVPEDDRRCTPAKKIADLP